MLLQDNTTSQFDSRYCIHCQEQETSRLKSLEEVREGSVRAVMGAMGKTQEEAEKITDQLLPTLPRWKTPQ
jgi:hypothetical protein